MKYDTVYAAGALLAGFGLGQMNPADDGWKTIVLGGSICVLAMAASVHAAWREARGKKDNGT